MRDYLDFDNGIFAFDAGYMRPSLVAIHAIVDRDRVAFVDTGTQSSLPRVQQFLHERGLGPEAVDYVILTHVHLDHAGGAGAMMAAFPRARLVVHPRGARHMADPANLIAGVEAVYGVEKAFELYGRLIPIPAERMLIANDGFAVTLGARELRFIDTPGHARHHVCILDTSSRGIFAGDMFGVSYRELDEPGRRFIFPTTTPTQFDPEAMHRSIDLLLSFDPEAIYLTHYSQVKQVRTLSIQLRRMVDEHVRIARSEADAGGDRQRRIETKLAELFLSELRDYGSSLSEADALKLLSFDITLNAQGLVSWLDALDARPVTSESARR